MADGASRSFFRLYSGAASEARPALASGPQTNAAAWKGMGSARCPARRPAQAFSCLHPLPTRFLLPLLMVYTLAWTCVSGFVQNSSACQIDVCWEHYQTAKDQLELEASSAAGAGNVDSSAGGVAMGVGVAVLDNEAQCLALRTYWGCIKTSSRGCQGDIRYYSVRNGVKNQMKQYNCSVSGPTLEPSKPHLVPPPHVPYECHYHGRKVFRHCGLFGDPHLRTFNNQFQTCKVKGAWPIVNNDYLTVQVTNDPVPGGSSDATATSKLTVIVKTHSCGSSQFQTYQAQTDSLPGSFDDGHAVHGAHGGLELVELEPNRHVEIHIRYIATTVVVRQIGRYFTFAIRMPEELVNSSQSGELELCTRGCPPSERINYQEYLAERRGRAPHVVSAYEPEEEGASARPMTRQEAEAVCRDAQLVDFYFDSCVFDLMATGDRNFTLAAIKALQDVLRLDPAMATQHSNRTDLEKYDAEYSTAAALCSRWSAVLRVTWTLSIALVTLFYPQVAGNR